MATDYEPIGQSDHTPVEHKTPQDCPEYETGRDCMFCDGGLFACEVCGGLEGGMPTQCPGRKMAAEEIDEVYAGRVDFINGQWYPRTSQYSPASYRKYYV